MPVNHCCEECDHDITQLCAECKRYLCVACYGSDDDMCWDCQRGGDKTRPFEEDEKDD